MTEHGSEDKIAEETQQVTRALIYKSEAYRQRLVDLGMTDAMVHVMQVNAHDRGALDLTCVNLAMLVGPQWDGSGTPDPTDKDEASPMAFNKTTQAKALESGALEVVTQVVMPGREMHHKEHGNFNFDVNAAYNVNKDCFLALADLGHENPAAVALMSKAGLADAVIADLSRNPADPLELFAGCSLMTQLSAGGHATKPSACNR